MMETQIVLLVDDEPNVLRGLLRTLRSQPYSLFTAPSGEMGIEIIKEQKVSLVVSDQKMNGMSGFDFLKWVQENYPEIPKIMLTGEASPDLARRASEEAGVDRFFAKPCNDNALATAITELLDPQSQPLAM